MPNNDVLLRVENLCQYFKLDATTVNKAVDNVSFDIKKGEVFGLVGESGQHGHAGVHPRHAAQHDLPACG